MPDRFAHLLSAETTNRFTHLLPETDKPFEMGFGEKAKEVGKALFLRMPQHLAATVGMGIHAVSDYDVKDAPLAPPAAKALGAVWRKIQPEWHKNLEESSRGVGRRYGNQIADFWIKSASTGSEAMSPELAQASWTEAPVTKALTAAGEASGSWLTAIATTLITKNPQLGLAVLASQSGVGARYKQIKAGSSKAVANTVGLLTGAAEAATEMVPFHFIFNTKTKGLLKKFLVGAAPEGLQEFVQGLIENTLEHAGYNYKDPASIPDAVKEGISHAFDDWQANVSAGILLGGGTKMALPSPPTLPVHTVVKVDSETGKVLKKEGEYDSGLTAYEAAKEKTTPDDRYNKIEYEIREPGESLTKPRTYAEEGTAEEAYAAEEAKKAEDLEKGKWSYKFKQPKGRYLIKHTNKEGVVLMESRFETEEETQLYKQGAEAMLPAKELGTIEIIKMTKDGKRPAVKPEESYYKEPPSDVPTFIETAEGTMGYDPGIYNIPEVEQLALAAEMTYEDAYQLYTDINDTSKRGLTRKKVKSLVDALSTHLKKENPTPRLSQGFFKDVYNKTFKGLKTYHYSMSRIYQVLKDMDGGIEGPLINTVYKPMKKALVKSHLDRNNLQKEILSFFVENDINLTEFFKSTSQIAERGKTFKISPLQKVQVYLNTLNPDNLRHLQNTLSQKNIDNIVNSMTEEEFTVAQWLLDKYSEGFDETANVYNQSTGETLEQEDNYVHIDVEKDFINFQQDLEEETITRRKKIPRKAPRGFTKERIKATAPLRLRDALSAFVDHEMKRRHYNAIELNAKDVLSLINNPKLSQRLNNTAGINYKNILNKWVNDAATERVEEINNWFNKFMSGMRRNYVAYALGFNLVTIMRQPISFWLACAKDPLVLVNSLTHAHKLSTDYGKYSKEAFEKSNILKARFMERELKELAMLKSPKKVLGKKISRENAFAMVRAMDKITVTAVWQGAYQAAQQRGMKSVDAIEYADSIVTTTQPMGGLEDLPDIFRGGTFAKMFTAFQNQINQQYNFWAYDVIQAKKKGRINNLELSWRVMMGHIIPAFIMGLVSRGRLPDEKEVLTDQAGYLIMPLYFFGNLVNNLIQGYGGRETLPLQVYDDIADIKEHKGLRSKIKAGLRATGRGFGLPLNQPIRSMEGALDLFNQEDTDYRRLVWSKYMLQKKEEPSTERPVLRRRKRGGGRGAR